MSTKSMLRVRVPYRICSSHEGFTVSENTSCLTAHTGCVLRECIAKGFLPQMPPIQENKLTTNDEASNCHVMNLPILSWSNLNLLIKQWQILVQPSRSYCKISCGFFRLVLTTIQHHAPGHIVSLLCASPLHISHLKHCRPQRVTEEGKLKFSHRMMYAFPWSCPGSFKLEFGGKLPINLERYPSCATCIDL